MIVHLVEIVLLGNLKMYLDDTIVEVTATTYPEIRYTAISRKVVRKKKMCTWKSRKILWDMINTLFLALSMSNLLFLLSFTTHNYTPWPLVPFFQIFFWKTLNLTAPTIPFGLVACTFSDNLSRKSCIYKADSYFCLAVRHTHAPRAMQI